MEDLFEGGRQSECVRERKRGGEGKEGRKEEVGGIRYQRQEESKI